MTENYWYIWHLLPPNRHGLTHVLTEKKTGAAWVVHANGARFPVRAGVVGLWWRV